VKRALHVLGCATLVACVEPPRPTSQAPIGRCGAIITDVPIEPSPHVDYGSPIEWTSNPPSSGPHYPVWVEWDRRYPDLMRGLWLHNAEHGGVVLLHRCADADCPGVVVDLVATIDALPDDPHCVAPVRTRTLIAYDPLLPEDADVAAVAWGTTYTAACVDDTLGTFARDHIGRGAENFCDDGIERGGLPLH
jgi:hypothetical protein